MPATPTYPDLLAQGETPSWTGKQVQKFLNFTEPNSVNTLARLETENHRYLPSYVNTGDGWELAGPNTNFQRWFFPDHVKIWDEAHPTKPRHRQPYMKKVSPQMITEVLTEARAMQNGDPTASVNRKKLQEKLQEKYPGRWSRWWYQSMAEILDENNIPAKRRQPQASRRVS